MNVKIYLLFNFLNIPMYLFLDLETTGLEYKWDDIVQIGAVKMNFHGEIKGEFIQLIKPNKLNLKDDFQTAIHGITALDLENAEDFISAYDRFKVFSQGCTILVAHNLIFDWSFWETACQNHNLDNYLDGLEKVCTYKMALKTLQFQHVSLDRLCKYFNISLYDRMKGHDALQDSYLLMKVFKALKSRELESSLTCLFNEDDEELNKCDLNDFQSILN